MKNRINGFLKVELNERLGKADFLAEKIFLLVVIDLQKVKRKFSPQGQLLNRSCGISEIVDSPEQGKLICSTL